MLGRPRFFGAVGRGPLLILSLLVAIACLAPRSIGLTQIQTPDERLWLGRSANFYQALASGDLENTFQFVHPGVTVMWLGALSYVIRDPGYADANGQLGERMPLGYKPDEVIGPSLLERGIQPIEMLAAQRVAVIVAYTLVLIASFWVMVRLFGLPAGALAAFLIALDPFTIGLTRLMHLDGLTGGFMTLSLLHFLAYVYRGRHRADLIASGAVAGLAWLTRTSGFFLVAFIAAFVFVELMRQVMVDRRGAWRGVRRALETIAVWSLAGLIIYVLFWPALWVNPIETLRLTIFDAFGLASGGHGRSTFFGGEIRSGDPGLAFYAVTFLWRTTPVVVVGLLAAVCWMIVPRLRASIGAEMRGPIVALALFALTYGAALSLIAKKFDRYLLPAYAPLIIVAAWGWIQVARSVRDAAPPASRIRPMLVPAVAAVAIAGQLAVAVPSVPYYLSFYNALFGGASRAASVMMVGWGEGFDQVARYLNALPDAEALVLATGKPNAVEYLFSGITIELFSSEADTSAGSGATPRDDPALAWVQADFYAVYIDQVQRGFIPPAMLDYFAARAPELTVTLGGLDYIKLYDLRQAPFPAAFLGSGSSVTDWDATVRVVAADFPTTPSTASEPIATTWYVSALGPDGLGDRPLTLHAAIVGRQGALVSEASEVIVSPPENRTIWPIPIRLRLPDGIKPGQYTVQIWVTENGSDNPLLWGPGGTDPAHRGAATIASVVVRNDQVRVERLEATAAEERNRRQQRRGDSARETTREGRASETQAEESD